jgi:hypothetical protein
MRWTPTRWNGWPGESPRWLVTPTRRLPTGMTLSELAGDDLDEFSTHVKGALGGFAATVEIRHARYAV